MENHNTVIIKLKGGMGNQMFQYAFGKALEYSMKTAGKPVKLLFDTTAYTNPVKKDTLRPYLLPLLNTNAHTAQDALALKIKNPHGILSEVSSKIKRKLKAPCTSSFEPSLLQPPYKNYYEGYWQSEKYFLPIADQLRQEFTLREPFGKEAQAMYEIISADPHSVSIFYRRTDYVGHSQFDIGEQDYQQRAIVHIRELVPEARLYVMSDDIEWVKENAELPEGSIFVSSKDIPPQEEMFLAAICKHHIIPNSTFAWWGAWLNLNPHKIVVAPKNWVRSKSDQNKDIIPNNWERV